jgi:glycosyltransferase involved in cell wall biosynthesis
MTDPAPVHVVMLVANDATNDARVRKTALAVAATGARVTLVAQASDGVRSDHLLGPVRITRVPVEFVLRDAARSRALRRRTGGLPVLRPLGPEREIELRHRAAARQRDLEPGPLARQRVELQRQSLRGRRVLGRAGAKASRTAWGSLDRVRAQVALGARWRTVLPEVDDYELAFGPVVDALEPDVIHAHDVQLLPVAARAVDRAAAAGRTVRWIYDAHEWVVGLSRYRGRTRRTIAAWADLEREFAGRADRVVTVSGDLADALQRRYPLTRRPAVVMNIPADPEPRLVGTGDTGRTSETPRTGIRETAGVGSAPLMVYSGGVQEARGVQTAVQALTELPDVHLAVVAVPSPYAAPVERLRELAGALGVADRVHILPPVAPDAVVAFLRGADVGVIPLRHFGSHEFALANKLFEYLHAGLPMVVSDCRAQSEFVTRNAVGLVHRADDASDLARQVRAVLDDPDRWRSALAAVADHSEYTWAGQSQALQEVYEDLTAGAVRAVPLDPSAGREPSETAFDRGPDRPVLLGIGPTNSAGQAWAWTRAVRRRWPELGTEVVALVNGRYDYPCDVAVTPATFSNDPTWGLNLREHAREAWTHALIEAGRPLFGRLGGDTAAADIEALQAARVRVGLVFHGSEIRSPRDHARTHEFSPFDNPRDAYTQKLQATADRNLALAAEFAGPVFVSTPDQLDYLPDATWLPVCLDLEEWPLEVSSREVPLVVHAPSNPRLKGTEEIESVLAPLVESGRITYQRVTGMQPAEAAAVVRSADIVIDQVLLGLYGVLACEAIASGAVVLGHVGPTLRSRVPGEIPVVEVTPNTLASELEGVLENLGEYRRAAPERRRFVETFHDGCYASGVLEPFLRADGAPAAAATEVQ